MKLILKKINFGIFLCIILAIVFSIPSTLFENPTCTLLEDENGNLLGARIAKDGQWRFPPSDTYISPKFEQALLCFEDSRFYQHHGIDGIAVIRSLIQNYKHQKIKEGASTLSMQVIRMMRKNKGYRNGRTLVEKLTEATQAFCLEFKYSKTQILALYAHNAPFGSNVVGVDAAAWRYFGRSCANLSWAEAATLAVLPNAPGLIHPGRNRTQLKEKRNLLLKRLWTEGYIDEETCYLAQLEQLPDKPMLLPQSAPHLLDKMASQYSGIRLETTISGSIQENANIIAQRHIDQFKANGVYNAAIIVAEIATGKVLAYVGNANDVTDKQNGSSVDIITSKRSTGSILKPFLYAAMLDEGLLLPNTLLADIPLHIAGFSPTNYNKTFDGAVPAHEALERSLNVPAVRMLNDYNIEKFHSLLKDMGMQSLNKPSSHYGLSLILGGAEGSLWDMVGMYASMARVLNNFRPNNGVYHKSDWHPLYYTNKATQPETKLYNDQIIGAGAIYQTFEALAELNRPEEESSWKMFTSNRKLAWKTGTSYGNRDAWAIGVNTVYAIGVWVGNADGEGRPMLTGVGYAAPLLFDVANTLPNVNKWFDCPYDELIQQLICRKSGHKAGDFCTETDSMWITNNGINSLDCPYHQVIHLDASATYQVNSNCYPPNKMKHTNWFVLPPAQAWYYQNKHIDYKPLPPLLEACIGTETKAMQLIYPSSNLTIVLTKQLDGSVGKLVAQAAHARQHAQIYWYLNNHFLGTTTGNHQMAFSPSPGLTKLYLTDDKGEVLESKFMVNE